MRMTDLPKGQLQKSLSRRVYSFFWLPFELCWDLVTDILARILSCARVGFSLAAFGWMFMMCFMYFMNALTPDVAFGMALIAIPAGAGITILYAALK